MAEAAGGEQEVYSELQDAEIAADTTSAGVKQADAAADRAMAWLKQAVAAGYNNVDHMRKDKDLDALRDREDMKKLLAELGAKSSSP